jgi:hypothetical protein
MAKPHKPKPMLCYVCRQKGHGPLSQDAYGYKHTYGCNAVNSKVPLNYFKGKMCIIDFNRTCQESAGCIGCCIYLNKVEERT